MKIELLGERKIIMSNPGSRFNYFAWPTVERLGDGRIAVGASGYRIDHICPFGKAVVSFSEDEGESYTYPAPIIDTYLDDRDVGLCSFGESGLILTTFNNKREFQGRVNHRRDDISDAQKAFVDAYLDIVPLELEERDFGSLFRISHDNGRSFGAVYKSPVTSPHGPTELSDGTVIWVGSVFSDNMTDGKISSYKVNTENGECSYLGDIKTDHLLAINNILEEPYAFETEPGRIVCLIRTTSTEDWKRMFTLYQSVSEDGGVSWSDPVQILPDRGGAPGHMMRHSSGAIIASFGFRDKPFGIKVMASFDGGVSWDAPEYVYHTEYVKPSWDEYTRGCDIGYASTVELKDGSLLTVFYAYPNEDGPVIMQQRWKIVE